MPPRNDESRGAVRVPSRAVGATCLALSRSQRVGAGQVRPRALAVLRFMTSSNLVGWMIGKSAGFSPLRARPV
jgi:hypothetical protein